MSIHELKEQLTENGIKLDKLLADLDVYDQRIEEQAGMYNIIQEKLNKLLAKSICQIAYTRTGTRSDGITPIFKLLPNNTAYCCDAIKIEIERDGSIVLGTALANENSNALLYIGLPPVPYTTKSVDPIAFCPFCAARIQYVVII